MKKLYITVGVTLFTLGITRTLWAEQETTQGKLTVVNAGKAEVLKGIKAYNIFVPDLNDDAKKLGIVKEELEKVVELSLRRNGVPVVDKDEWSKIAGSPFLRVQVFAFKSSVDVRISNHEAVFLYRDKNTVISGADTYATGGLMVVNSADFVYKSVERYVDGFCLQYLRQNPKDGTAPSEIQP